MNKTLAVIAIWLAVAVCSAVEPVAGLCMSIFALLATMVVCI